MTQTTKPIGTPSAIKTPLAGKVPRAGKSDAFWASIANEPIQKLPPPVKVERLSPKQLGAVLGVWEEHWIEGTLTLSAEAPQTVSILLESLSKFNPEDAIEIIKRWLSKIRAMHTGGARVLLHTTISRIFENLHSLDPKIGMALVPTDFREYSGLNLISFPWIEKQLDFIESIPTLPEKEQTNDKWEKAAKMLIGILMQDEERVWDLLYPTPDNDPAFRTCRAVQLLPKEYSEGYGLWAQVDAVLSLAIRNKSHLVENPGPYITALKILSDSHPDYRSRTIFSAFGNKISFCSNIDLVFKAIGSSDVVWKNFLNNLNKSSGHLVLGASYAGKEFCALDAVIGLLQKMPIRRRAEVVAILLKEELSKHIKKDNVRTALLAEEIRTLPKEHISGILRLSIRFKIEEIELAAINRVPDIAAEERYALVSSALASEHEMVQASAFGFIALFSGKERTGLLRAALRENDSVQNKALALLIENKGDADSFYSQDVLVLPGTDGVDKK